MLKINCINHRVKLRVKSAFLHRLLDNEDVFYKSNFCLLRNSGKRKEIIQEAVVTIRTMFYNQQKIHGTRFIGHRKGSLKSLLETWLS